MWSDPSFLLIITLRLGPARENAVPSNRVAIDSGYSLVRLFRQFSLNTISRHLQMQGLFYGLRTSYSCFQNDPSEVSLSREARYFRMKNDSISSFSSHWVYVAQPTTTIFLSWHFKDHFFVTTPITAQPLTADRRSNYSIWLWELSWPCPSEGSSQWIALRLLAHHREGIQIYSESSK